VQDCKLGTYNVLRKCYVSSAYSVPAFSADPLRCLECSKSISWNRFHSMDCWDDLHYWQ